MGERHLPATLSASNYQRITIPEAYAVRHLRLESAKWSFFCLSDHMSTEAASIESQTFCKASSVGAFDWFT